MITKGTKLKIIWSGLPEEFEKDVQWYLDNEEVIFLKYAYDDGCYVAFITYRG